MIGNDIDKACKAIGVHQSTYRRWLKNDTIFHKKIKMATTKYNIF